jgi:hypothetical protein
MQSGLLPSSFVFCVAQHTLTLTTLPRAPSPAEASFTSLSSSTAGCNSLNYSTLTPTDLLSKDKVSTLVSIGGESATNASSSTPCYQASLCCAGQIPDRPAPHCLSARHFRRVFLLLGKTATGSWEVLLLLPDPFHLHRLLQQPAAHVRLICRHVR